MWKRREILLGGAVALAIGAALSDAATAEPAGDETFEGTFSCLKPSSAADKGPILCQSQINPGLPVLDLAVVWHEDKQGHERILDRIDIRRAGETNLLQAITGIDSRLMSDVENAGLEMLDLNFDGFLDMRVMRFMPAGPNTPYQNWLWSKEDGKFVANPGLDAITSPKFNAEDQEIVSRWRSSAAEGGTDVYSYEGTTPVLVHRETDRFSGNGACVRTFYDRIDDELKATGTGTCEAE